MVKMNHTALADLMKERGVKQKQAAEFIGVTESHFSRKMSGEYSFKQSEISKLCDLLQIADSEIAKCRVSTRLSSQKSRNCAISCKSPIAK